jgi:hypothetical protein
VLDRISVAWVGVPPAPADAACPPFRRPSERSLERWKVRTTEHASVAGFLGQRQLPNGIHTINGAESPIDILIRARPGAPVIFSFHGNTPRSPELQLPVFTGLNVTKDLDASLVALSDPTLNLDADLRLGWFAGSAGLRLQTVLPTILAHIAAVLAAPRIIFFGGSGGGFAALYYAAGFPDSLSVVWNPQTDIRRYNPPHIEDYGRVAFGWGSLDETRDRLADEIVPALAQVYASGRDNLVLYLQNASDGHVANHMLPLLDAMNAPTAEIGEGQPFSGPITKSVWVHLGQWGTGHASPPVDFHRALLTSLLAAPEWRDDFASGRLATLIG